MKKVILILLMFQIYLFANQADCIKEVMVEARKYTYYPTTIAGKAMQESSCGLQVIGDDRTSFGILQFQLATAREELGKTKYFKHLAKLSDRRLSSILTTNNKLSIMLASKRFERKRKQLGYKKAVQAHNGLRGNFIYFYKVEKWKKWLNKRKYRR